MTTPKILIVEDEQVVAMDIESQLIELGYEVIGVASTGMEAWQLAEEKRPDLVLMDIQLHGSYDGIAVAHQMIERWQIPVVFVTAYANHNVIARAEEVQHDGYLRKPYNSRDLSHAVQRALEKHASR